MRGFEPNVVDFVVEVDATDGDNADAARANMQGENAAANVVLDNIDAVLAREMDKTCNGGSEMVKRTGRRGHCKSSSCITIKPKILSLMCGVSGVVVLVLLCSNIVYC